MSDVSPIGRPGLSALNRMNQPPQRTVQATANARGRDQVELSQTAQMLSKIHELPDIRQGLVDRVRTEIQNGSYETPEKLEAALQQLLDEEQLS